MKRLYLLLLFNCFTCLNFGQGALDLKPDTLPNIIVIVADDLGYSDISPYGGEIHTPVLAKLANQSILLSNFHTLPMCAPTRSVLLSGTDNHLVGLGAQQGAATEKQLQYSGYEGYLNDRVAILPEVLKAKGYRTYLSGKWHLGHDISHGPFTRGFQETFALLSGGASHYADQIPLYPLVTPVYERNGKQIAQLPEDFYSTKNYTDTLISWMERDKNTGSPFLAYLAYTAPHDPLHAPKEYIDKYEGKYDEGYEALRIKRFNQLKKLGHIPSHQPLPEWPVAIKKWEKLNESEKENTIRDMETYAAMVDYMDEQIGRVYDWLASNGQLDNTLIIFMSDNGANGSIPSKIYPGFSDEFAAQFDQSLENRGLPNSFTHMGAGWATASTAAFKYFKTFTTEGGIRTACIIKPPYSIKRKFLKDENRSFTHVKDIMPTILEMTQITHPSTQNKELVKMSGKSLLPLITGSTDAIHEAEGIGFELHGGRAFIKDGWKIVQTPMPLGNAEWELYNIEEDPAESKNLIFSNRIKFKSLLAEYYEYEKANGVVFDLPYIMGQFSVLFNVLYWLLIALFGLAILGKLSGKLKEKYLAWGYGIPFMYALAAAELIAVAGIFTMYYHYTAWFLVAVMAGAFYTLIKNKENWKAYILPILATILLGLFLFAKSDQLYGLLT